MSLWFGLNTYFVFLIASFLFDLHFSGRGEFDCVFYHVQILLQCEMWFDISDITGYTENSQLELLKDGKVRQLLFENEKIKF